MVNYRSDWSGSECCAAERTGGGEAVEENEEETDCSGDRGDPAVRRDLADDGRREWEYVQADEGDPGEARWIDGRFERADGDGDANDEISDPAQNINQALVRRSQLLVYSRFDGWLT